MRRLHWVRRQESRGIEVPERSKALHGLDKAVHGFHVIVGMGLISWLLRRTVRKDFSPHYYTPVELVGFYWHFVDLVWIYLFPLMYLVG